MDEDLADEDLKDCISGDGISFDQDTGKFEYQLTDQHGSAPFGNYQITIQAYAGTGVLDLSEISDGINNAVVLNLELSCVITASQFEWLVPEEKDHILIRKDYDPDWLLSMESDDNRIV